MMRRHRPGRSKFPAFILGLAGILICVTCMSAETLLVILSLPVSYTHLTLPTNREV